MEIGSPESPLRRRTMPTANLIALITALLPTAENIASIWIHNPNSKHQFTVVTGEVNAIAGVASAITQQRLATAATATVTGPVATPAAT